MVNVDEFSEHGHITCSSRMAGLRLTQLALYRGSRALFVFVVILTAALCVYIMTYVISPFTSEPIHTSPTMQDQNYLSFLKSYLKEGEHFSTSSSSSSSSSDTVELDTALERSNISYAYDKGWVGLPELTNEVNCLEPLNHPTLNRLYPHTVRRTFPADFRADARNCASFKEKYGYVRYPEVSEEEKNFPIAFIILFHKDIDQVHLLLRAIYRPHNVYCLSIDTKSSIELLEATISMSRCLPNVFVASKLENIVYGGYSRLMADIHCMRDLMSHPVKWRYVINCAGQQFPLKTNLEFVKILTILNGTNDVLGVTGEQRNMERFTYKWINVKNETTGKVNPVQTDSKLEPPPHGLEPIKCSAYGSLTRAFVDYVLNTKIAKDLLEWCKHVYSPDELYWGTLNYNNVKPAPGGFIGVPDNFWLTSFSLWEFSTTTCIYKFVRKVCIFSTADLPMLLKKQALFANKFYLEPHPVALHCLDHFLYNLTLSGRTRDMPFSKKFSSTYKGTRSQCNSHRRVDSESHR